MSDLSPFATVRRGMLLQPSDGYGQFIGQPPLFHPRQFPQPPQTSQPIAGRLVFLFEPSMLRTRDSTGRRGAHGAPVENVAGESNNKAKEKQMLFSPFFCPCAGLASCPRNSRQSGWPRDRKWQRTVPGLLQPWRAFNHWRSSRVRSGGYRGDHGARSRFRHRRAIAQVCQPYARPARFAGGRMAGRSYRPIGKAERGAFPLRNSVRITKSISASFPMDRHDWSGRVNRILRLRRGRFAIATLNRARRKLWNSVS